MDFEIYLSQGNSAFFSTQRLAEYIEAWARPINRNSPAMRDGRSTRPAAPEWVQDELATRNINQWLGTSYTVAEIQKMPYAWILKMHLLIEATSHNDGTS